MQQYGEWKGTYPWGWAQVGNTPSKWYKQNTHEGGVRVPLVVHWPSRFGGAAGGGAAGGVAAGGVAAGGVAAGGDGVAAGGDGVAAGGDGVAAGGDGVAAGGDGVAAGGVAAGGVAAGGDGVAGGVRGQFHHVNDIAATIYDLIDIEPPTVRRGLEQIPVSGTSLVYTFDDPGAATRKEIQYFEMAGHRGLWHDGWKAVTRHEAGVPFDNDTWELYHRTGTWCSTTTPWTTTPSFALALLCVRGLTSWGSNSTEGHPAPLGPAF